MTELADLIRTELGVGEDSYFLSHEAMRGTIEAVLDLHKPMRIFDECGHTHVAEEPGVLYIEDVGLVCEDGYEYTICRHCCADDDYHQTETCVSDHSTGSCYPCSTVMTVGRALDLVTEAVASDGD